MGKQPVKTTLPTSKSHPKPKKKSKKGIIIVVLITIFVVAGYHGNKEALKNYWNRTQSHDKISDISYIISSEYDSSFANAIRKNLKVVIPERDYSEEEIKNLFMQITEDYIEKAKVNALSIYLYDREVDTFDVYTIGMCLYAPYGNISDAVNVKAGEYNTFEYVFTIKSNEEKEVFKKINDEVLAETTQN